MIKGKSLSLPTVHVSSLLFICALFPALLFKGPQIEFFAVTQILLVMWLGCVVLQSHGSGLSVPKTALALCLTLFWLWLAISLSWSLAPSISVINFWWVGSLVLVFWLYTLTPDRDALWSHAAAIILVLGIVLALMGVYQVLVLEQQARSVFETPRSESGLLHYSAENNGNRTRCGWEQLDLNCAGPNKTRGGMQWPQLFPLNSKNRPMARSPGIWFHFCSFVISSPFLTG